MAEMKCTSKRHIGFVFFDIARNRAIGQKVCVKTDITVDISIVMSV